MIQASVGVEVLPQAPPEGHHMANGRVEMAVREVKRQCRTLRISAEQNKSVRIADDSPLLSWLPRLVAHVMNKMRIGKDGKTSEMRRTGRRRRKPVAQFAERVWFREIEAADNWQVVRLKKSLLVITIEQEPFCLLPRMEVCAAKVGRD